MENSTIYKGYTITRHKKEGYVVSKNGVVVTSQPSIQFAMKFIDGATKE